jgi:hypothetical protein
MPEKIIPETQLDALFIVGQAWSYLMKKNPVIFWPLTFYLLFGGGIFAYNYFTANKFEVKEAKPLGAEFSIMPKAYAGGIPIRFEGKTWGYADTNFVAVVRIDAPGIVVYDKRSKRVFNVEFSSPEDFRKQMSK